MLSKIVNILKFIKKHPLTREKKINTIIKFLRWQVGARLVGRKVIVPWVEESRFIAEIGETGLTGNLYAGFLEYKDMLFLLHALQSDEIFIDVGANIGAYTILASKVIGVESISFEPLPDTVRKLQDQIQINRIDHLVKVINKGVGDKLGELFFTNNNDTVNKVSLKSDFENTTKVNVTTLDYALDYAKKYFFKIDVEGFEYNVIQGGSNILSSQNTSALIIELNDSGLEFGFSNEEIHEKIISFGFVPVNYDPASRSLTLLDSYHKNGENTIYIKDFESMVEKCKIAPKRCIHTANNIYL
jgi:FkbM family methyltransferase